MITGINACNLTPENLIRGAFADLASQFGRVIAHLETTHENITDIDTRDMDICYPYGYSNDIYGYLHDDLWMDYQIKGGSAFIELIDAYVDEYFSAE